MALTDYRLRAKWEMFDNLDIRGDNKETGVIDIIHTEIFKYNGKIMEMSTLAKRLKCENYGKKTCTLEKCLNRKVLFGLNIERKCAEAIKKGEE